jgi:biotin carboxylase
MKVHLKICITHLKNLYPFCVAHGYFLEDSRLQDAIEAKDLTFFETESKGGAPCRNKVLTKQIVARTGIPVIDGIDMIPARAPSTKSIVNELG